MVWIAPAARFARWTGQRPILHEVTNGKGEVPAGAVFSMDGATGAGCHQRERDSHARSRGSCAGSRKPSLPVDRCLSPGTLDAAGVYHANDLDHRFEFGARIDRKS